MTFDDWTFWYHVNKEALEAAASRSRTGESSPRASRSPRVREVAIPTVVRTLENEDTTSDDLASAAIIALARLAREPKHVEVLLANLEPATDRRLVLRESAALALGLLRRTHESDRFDAVTLDGVRRALLSRLEDGTESARVRVYAALAVGLLGDQPVGPDEPGTGSAASRTTARLFDVLAGVGGDADLSAAALHAIGLQAPGSVSEEQRRILTDCVTRGRLVKRPALPIVRAQAAHTLGRIGTRAELQTFRTLLIRRRGRSPNELRSAVLGLGLLGSRLEPADRLEASEILLKSIGRMIDASGCQFAIVALADLLVAEVGDGSAVVMEGGQTADFLLATAEQGRHGDRSAAALGLGLVVRACKGNAPPAAYAEFVARALATLRSQGGERRDRSDRAAVAVALGVSGDQEGVPFLTESVKDRRYGSSNRAYAALALGLVGSRDRGALDAVLAAHGERRFDLRRLTAVALGLMGAGAPSSGGPDTVQLLVSGLRTANGARAKGELVRALALLDDPRAFDALAALVADEKVEDLTRALACVGLGLLGEPNDVTSLVRLWRRVNYRALAPLIMDALSIL